MDGENPIVALNELRASVIHATRMGDRYVAVDTWLLRALLSQLDHPARLMPNAVLLTELGRRMKTEE